jgi:hypothetical protein
MPLAAILGMCLLLLQPRPGIPGTVFPMAVGQSTQPQEQPGKSSQQSAPAPADQQGIPDQSLTPPPPPASIPPCPEKSQSGSATGPDCKPADSARTRTRKHRRTHKTVAPVAPPGETPPTKTVVRNGSAADPTVDLSPGQDQQQAAHPIEERTEELLASSEANLKKLSEVQLGAGQQDVVKQTKSYTDQAKKAASEGDVQRAYSLAVKANLLAETTLLLAPSEANLKKLSDRQLNDNQQDTVEQIKSYIEQATKAAGDGDGQRAHNLGVKANLLSAELIGH